MLYSCTHMATVGFKGLNTITKVFYTIGVPTLQLLAARCIAHVAVSDLL